MRQTDQMTGPASVELLLDSTSEALVRADWDALEAEGLSSLAAHRAASNRPHITVVEGTTDAATDALAGAAIAVPFAVTLGPPILFGAGPRRVLARSVVPSAELLSLHTAVHEQLGAASDSEPRLRPGNWVPHVTLARRIRLDDLAKALDLLGDDITGQVVSVRRWNSETREITQLAG
jgi:2'-5' RNA ligase